MLLFVLFLGDDMKKDYDKVLAWYAGNLVTDFEYVTDKKRRFRVACQRVQDNLDTGQKGYVRDERGKYFEIIEGKRLAYPLPEIPSELREVA
jgi:hypothetical protein